MQQPSDTPCLPAGDGTIPQRHADYTPDEHAVWNRLLTRQMQILPGRAVPDFLAGVERLGLHAPGIPDFERLNERLQKLTGWSVVAVPGLIPDALFFEHLANRRFVAGRFIRRPEELDYLEEPDVFHDVFGHVPLLSDPTYADYMQAYGEGGLRALRLGSIDRLARLYWHTVEFGLIRSIEGLRIFGAGIVSSFGETHYALDDPRPPRVPFDLLTVMRTRYRIDTFQTHYFVIDSFEDLLRRTLDVDFGPLYESLDRLAELDPPSFDPRIPVPEECP